MKVSKRDVMSVLRLFRVANDNHSPSGIDRFASANPNPTNQLVSFRFDHKLFGLLIDDQAVDREAYILEQIAITHPGRTGKLFANPEATIDTYGLPYKGKDLYLFQFDTRKQRLDVHLAEQYPEYSRSTWQKYIGAGYVTVNGQLATSSKQDVDDTDKVAVAIPEAPDYADSALPILYIDDDWVVVDKPTGILTHSKGALHEEFTVADFFRRYTTVGLDTNRPGIVHRLDRDTSGVLIGARTPESFEYLKLQFSSRRVRKQYVAIVDGTPKQARARIDLPIGRNPSAPSTFRVDTNGKSAVTDYEVLATDGSHSLVRLYPHTGRTHQLRVHMAYLGTPITGDKVYGKSAARLFLHARELHIVDQEGNPHTFHSALPDEFSELLPESKDA